MPELRGGFDRIDLGGGYTLVAPGLRGRAESVRNVAADVRAAERSTPLLDEVLSRVEMSGVRTIDITATTTRIPAADANRDLRDPRGDDAMLLEVPDLGADRGQVVLSVDEAGAITWHFPLADDGEIQSPANRGAGGKKRFLIRRNVPSAPPPERVGDRALFGAIGRKLLKVIVYPVTDVLLNKPARAIAEHWEAANRAYGLRDFSPANYQEPAAAPGAPDRFALDGDAVRRLSAGRALLFIHGTFSTAHGAFHDIPSDLMATLHTRYGGRVFAFNHFSLSHDPKQNVEWLMQQLGALAPDASLDVDIVCHSRGGLVTRTLDEGSGAFGIDTGRVRVHRVVFAGVPNKGTLLADPDHMVEMIDRLTTGLNLVPPGGVADILEGILIAVKIIGHGALKALSGLASMHPDGNFLQSLNRDGRRDPEYFAISANYEPVDTGLRAIVSRAADTVVDRVFQNAENDLVVPEEGVYAANGNGGFPIGQARLLRLPKSAGVMHTKMFGQPDVVAKMNEWLA